MERIIVHLGAHRTGTTLFQEYLFKVSDQAEKNGFDLIGINQTRGGMLEGLFRGVTDTSLEQQRLAEENATKLLKKFERTKAEKRHLVLSDENIIGTMEENLRQGTMYPSITKRIRRFKLPFREVDRFYLSIRNTSDWWASCIFFLVGRGVQLPKEHEVERIAQSKRGWKDIIKCIWEEYPDVPITIRDFSFKLERPKRQLIMVSGWKYFDVTKNLAKKSNERKSSEYLRNVLLSKGEKEAAERLLEGGVIFPFNYRQKEIMENRYSEEVEWIANNLRPKDRYLIDGQEMASWKERQRNATSQIRENGALTHQS